jgi:hypothetical protein
MWCCLWDSRWAARYEVQASWNSVVPNCRARGLDMLVKPLNYDVCVKYLPNSCIEVHGPQLANEDVDETFANDVKVAGGESVIDIASGS